MSGDPQAVRYGWHLIKITLDLTTRQLTIDATEAQTHAGDWRNGCNAVAGNAPPPIE